MLSDAPQIFYGNSETAINAQNPAAGHTPPQNFLTANGSRDSHAKTLARGFKNNSPNAGKPYRCISWATIRERIVSPSRVEKHNAPFVILSTYVEHDARTHAVQAERGVFGGLAVDIDAGNPTMAEVIAAVSAVTGGALAEIYSSSSSSHDCRKWRVLIPLAAPLAGADYPDTQVALFGLLKAHGMQCDPMLKGTGQPIFLPNVPPARRGKDGVPLFYECHHAAGELLELLPGTAIVEARESHRARRAARQAEAAVRAADAAKKRQARVDAGTDFDAIAHFNDTHPVAALLAAYGFKQKRAGQGSDYSSPLSKSGSYSTQDRGDHWITLSAWAHDHDIGRTSQNGNRWGDAFDLFVGFEHHGNRRGAMLAYLSEIGRLDDSLDGPVPVVVEPLIDRGVARGLDDWRQEMGVGFALALRQPGLHFDGSQPGSGKTTCAILAIKQAIVTTRREAEAADGITPIERVLIALPDHANIRDRVVEMQEFGIDAVPYPERSDATCGNMEQVERAQALGLTAGAAVCWGCRLRDSCKANAGQYLHELQRAEQADFTLCTHERLRLGPDAATAGRDVIVLDEQPVEVLSPSISVRVEDMAPVVTLARTVRDDCLFERGRAVEPAPEERIFAAAIVAAYEAIFDAAEQSEGTGVFQIPMPAASEVPKHWQTTLMKWADSIGVDIGSQQKKDRFQKSQRLLSMIVTGKLDSLHLLVEQTSRHELQLDGSVKEWQPSHYFVCGAWKTRLPKVPILCLDATTSPQDLRDATGEDVLDHTPAGYLPNVAPVTQVPLDITAGQSPAATAAAIEDYLHRNPQVQRLGVIGHRLHIMAIMGDDAVLSPRLRARIAKHCYHGQGPDRASNDWQESCDALLVIGTMRPGGGPVLERLVRHGKHEAARQSGDWGPRHWDGVTVAGEPFRGEGLGYRHAEWHHAHAAISRAAMHQCGGRGRAITSRGIPVTFYTTEPMGVPVDDSVEVVGRSVREAVEAVVRCRDGVGGESLLFPIERIYRKKLGSGVAVKVQAVVDLMICEASAGGWKLGRPAAEKALRLARRHGRLESPSKGWLLVSSSADAAIPVDAPEPTPQVAVPKPAMLSPPPQAVVIRATGPSSPVEAFDVVAGSTASTTICISTDIMPAALPTGVDHLRELLDERSAIMEFDGGLDREMADRLAAEMILGRVSAAPAGIPEQVAVDSQSLLARTHPLVDHAARLFGGTAILLNAESNESEFVGAQGQQPPPLQGKCVCGESEWVEVPIHGGDGARVDCGHCGRFGDFTVWHGKALTPGSGRSLGLSSQLNHQSAPRVEPGVLHGGGGTKPRWNAPTVPAVDGDLMQESGRADTTCTPCNLAIAQCN